MSRGDVIFLGCPVVCDYVRVCTLRQRHSPAGLLLCVAVKFCGKYYGEDSVVGGASHMATMTNLSRLCTALSALNAGSAATVRQSLSTFQSRCSVIALPQLSFFLHFFLISSLTYLFL